MTFGLLTDEMKDVLRPIVQGKTLWDLGAGDLGHAKTLLSLGARFIVAVDKNPIQSKGLRVLALEGNFDEVVPPKVIDLLFLSWPSRASVCPGLFRFLERSQIVIYLGSNTDGSYCGDHSLFEYLAGREILYHVPARRNSLIVYGAEHVERPLVGEEVAALQSQILSYEDAQRLAQGQSPYRKPSLAPINEMSTADLARQLGSGPFPEWMHFRQKPVREIDIQDRFRRDPAFRMFWLARLDEEINAFKRILRDDALCRQTVVGFFFGEPPVREHRTIRDWASHRLATVITHRESFKQRENT